MSVLKNNRDPSEFDYYYKFNKFYQFATDEIARIPKRKREYLTAKLAEPVSESLSTINHIYEKYWKEKLNITDVELAEKFHSQILRLSKPLLCAANIEAFPEKRLKQWEEHINMVMYNVNKKCNTNFTVENIYKMNKHKDVEFIKNMKLLHSYSYSKMIKAPKKYHDVLGAEITNLMDDALYFVLKGNCIFPKTKDDVLERERYFSSAIEKLHCVERPMYAYVNLRRLNDEEVTVWSKMLSEEIKLLSAVIKSDRRRLVNIK